MINTALIIKIIGISILSILLLLLILIFLILFMPINYKFEMSKCNNLYANITVKWIFKLFEYCFKMEGEKKETKILFVPLKILKKIKNKKNKKKEKKEVKVNKNNDEKSIKNIDINKRDSVETGDTYVKNSIKNKNKNVFEKEGSAVENLKAIINYKNKDELINPTIKLSKRLLRVFNPNKFKFTCTFGFDDPCITGYFLGIIYIVKSFLNLDINFNGNFEKKCLEFDIYASGTTNIFKIGLPIIMYISQKPIWNIIKNKSIKGHIH